MLKAGLVGAGHLGKIHLKLLNQSEKYDLVGFHDKDIENSKKLEAEFGYKFYENLDELLDKIEVLDIVTPTFYHHDYAKIAIERGLDFFIEKPVTQTLEQAEEIIQLCNEKGIRAQVGHVELRSRLSANQNSLKSTVWLSLIREERMFLWFWI